MLVNKYQHCLHRAMSDYGQNILTGKLSSWQFLIDSDLLESNMLS